MDLIYLRRSCRVIWTGSPFASLEGFSIQIATALNAGAGGSPVLSPSSQWMYEDQIPDLAIGYGDVGIVEHSKGNIWAGAGPITTKGHDGRISAEVDYVAVNAAGCGAALKEYGHLLEADAEYGERAAALAASTRDISELLAGDTLRVGGPVPARVTYDAACHLCHAQGLREEHRALLGAIPELVVLPLQE